MNFEFSTATRIIFGAGSLSKAGTLAAEMGWRALVVTGLGLQRAQPLLTVLAAEGVVSTLYMVEDEPTVEVIQRGVQLARRENCDLVIGFGGGSALDAGKAIASLVTNPGDIYDYLEVVGRGQALTEPPLPVIAIPTTASTGSEVTRNAVLGVPEHKVKVSLRSPRMLPRLALVDPELTYTLPPEITASTGLDALTQLIEPYVCNNPNPLGDGFCVEGLKRVAASLRTAYERGNEPAARQDMSLASLLGGLSLANARLGIVHGFAAVLGGMYPARHGAICARLLPFAMQVNLSAMRNRQPDHPSLPRYQQIAQILTGDPAATVEDGIAWVRSLCVALDIQPLALYGLRSAEFPQVIEKAARASSTRGNPIPLTSEEMEEILKRAI
jgi:alcohol dehydrogenase class IV